MQEFKYFQLAFPFNSNRLVTTAKKVYQYWSESQGLDTGRSWQLFDGSFTEYYNQKHTIRGYTGVSWSPIFPLDIDESSVENLYTTLTKLETIISALDTVQLYFSGRGYHVEIPSALFGIEACENLPVRLKSASNQLGFGTDPKLYQNSQLYRLHNSMNTKSELYKVKLDVYKVMDGMTLEDIKEQAEIPQDQSFNVANNFAYWEKMNQTEPIPALVHLWESTVTAYNANNKPKWGVNKGLRNINGYDTSLSLKTQFISRYNTKKVILEQNKKNNPPEPNTEELMRTVDSAYNGKYYKKFTINPVLQHLKEDVYWQELNDRRKRIYVQMLYDMNVRDAVYEGYLIKQNQFVYGKISTAKRWGVNYETLFKDMLKFERDSIINREVIKKGGKCLFTIITLLSFDVTHKYTHSIIKENEC